MRRWTRFTALVDADLAETLVERLTREPMPGLYVVRHGEVEARQQEARAAAEEVFGADRQLESSRRHVMHLLTLAGNARNQTAQSEESLSTLEREADRIKARKLAAKKAIEAGREPNLDLTRPKDARVPQTEDEKREKRRLKQLAWRVKNLERSREIVRESEKRRAAARAIAEGREPGKVGPPRRFTPEEKRAKRKAKTEAYNAANLDEVREKARIREAAKRAGTFVSKALPRLTEEEKRLTEVAWAATRRVRTRANGGKFTRADITWLATAQSGTCLFCGDPLGDEVPHIDHWVPISRGGSNDPDNLALLHQSCNGRKGAKMPADLGFPNDPRVLRAAIQDGLLSATNPVAGD